MSQKEATIEFAQTLEAVEVYLPFAKYPENIAFRHKKSGKWLGIIMEVEKVKLGLDGDGSQEIIVIKADPELVGILTETAGYLPAYHMNKKHWLAILLDGTVDLEQIKGMVHDSYELTK